MNRVLAAIGNYKWGTGSTAVAALVLFVGAILVFQYANEGRVDPAAMVSSSNPDLKRFLDGNAGWEYVDHYSRTSLYALRDRQTGNVALVDFAVLSGAKLSPRACDAAALPPHAAQYPSAAGTMCFEIVKPADSEDPFVAGMSFTVQAKQSRVAEFYRALFTREGRTVTVIQDSNRATILEAADASRNTVARVSIRSSFDTSRGFLAWTRDFRS